MCSAPKSTTWSLHRVQSHFKSPIQRLTIEQMSIKLKKCEMEFSVKQYMALLTKYESSAVAFTFPFIIPCFVADRGLNLAAMLL
jgi:hypothetical protein